MPTVNIEAEWFPPLQILAEILDHVSGELQNFSEPLRSSINNVVAPSIARNFDAGGRPAWVPLSEATVKIRGSAGPILDRTGTLRASASSPGLWEFTQTDAYLPGLPIWYGVLHQEGFGGSGRAHPIPARPFIMFQEEDVDAIEQTFVDWLGEVWAAW